MCGLSHANSESPNVKSRITLCEDRLKSLYKGGLHMKEVWKEIELYGLKYRISNHGRVVGKRGFIKQRLDNDGYPTITVGNINRRTSMKIHRLVATTFIPNPQKLPEVNHIDCNRQNSRADNLEWVTHQDNISHSVMMGNYNGKQLGEKNVRSRLTEDDVVDIRLMFDNGLMTQQELAKAYNVGWSTIHNIVFRLTWTHII